jgi:DNA-binding MarR family transcriptional regulator
MSKLLRDELIRSFIAAVRSSQTATALLDAAIADYVGIHDTDFRCVDILDQEGPMTAGRLAERARLSPGAMTSLMDRLERKGLAQRRRDSEDRRRVLVEVTPKLREMSAQLYGTPAEAADGLAAYTDEQLEFLIAFMRANTAFQEERMRRLDAIRVSEAGDSRSSTESSG